MEESGRKTELLQINRGGGPRASPRSCVLAGLPAVSSTPLDRIFDCKVFFVGELLRDSQRYKPTKTILLMNYPQINVVGGNHPSFMSWIKVKSRNLKCEFVD